jgi:hypothetical protein
MSCEEAAGDEMKLGLVFAFLFSFGLLPCGFAHAADKATSFVLLKSKSEKYPEVGLNDTITVRLNGGASVVPEEVKLLVAGIPVETTPEDLGESTDKMHRDLSFRLDRSADNKAAWAALLGNPLSHRRVQEREIDVVLSGDNLDYFPGPYSETEAGEPRIDLASYDVAELITGFALAILVVVITILLAVKTSIIRDSLVPQLRARDRSYSLGRTQMAFWLCIILAAFLFMLVITADLDTITGQSLTLLGIAGATALGAVVVDQNKGAPLETKQKNIAAMGLTSKEDVEILYHLDDFAADGSLAKAKPTISNAQLPSNPDPTVKELRDAYEAEISDIKTKGFFADLLTDVNGMAIHRWQIAAWTVTLGVIYIVRVNFDLQMPILGDSLLILMGISGGLYLGFKVPEQQSET